MWFVTLISLSFCYINGVLSETVGTVPGDITETTQPSLNRRSTANILFSCVITLNLALYTSLNLNIENCGKWYIRVPKKFKWVALGAIFPEWIMWTAIQQRRVANDIRKKIHIINKDLAKNRGQDEPQRWSLSTAFFATSGGFQVRGNEWMTIDGKILTPDGVLLLAEKGFFMDVDENSIVDKSKRDGLANFLILLQILWIFSQLFARIAWKLPVTLLEWNTIAHVICSLVLFCFWWPKPIDVYYPIVIDITDPYIMAVLSEKSPFNKKHNFHRQGPESRNNSVDSVKHEQSRIETENQFKRFNLKNVFPKRDGREVDHLGGEILNTWTEGLDNEAKFLALHKAHQPKGLVWLLPGQYWSNSSWRAKQPVHLEEARLLKLEKLNNIETQQEYKDAKNWEAKPKDRWERVPGEVYLRKSIPNRLYEEVGSRHIHPFASLLIFSAIYGGIQAAAWNEPFPTVVEQWLWRLGCGTVSASGLVIWVSVEGYVHLERSSTISKVIVRLILGICVVIFLLFRLFLFIEGFVSLRRLPDGALDSVPFLGVFPHWGVKDFFIS